MLEVEPFEAAIAATVDDFGVVADVDLGVRSMLLTR
jgi:hypothetical protein